MPANITGLPDYAEPCYKEPVYSEVTESYNADRAKYIQWRRLWAERDFHEAGEDYDYRNPDKPLVGIIDLLHHPCFPDVFQQKLVGPSEGEELLHPVHVKDFLEDKYATNLERPDWEHLMEILDHIEDIEPVPAPQNLKQARLWLEAKRTSLLAWPPVYGEPDAKGRRTRLHKVFAFDRSTQAHAKPQGKLDDLLRAPLTLASFVELLSNLKLIEEDDAGGTVANPAAKAGGWGGLVLALHKKQLLVGPASTVHRLLRSTFKANVSEKTISNAINEDGYQSVFHSKIVLSHLKTMGLTT